MKTALLIDADSKIPNLALMKLSSYYKNKGYKIKLLTLNISYYPTKKNKMHYIDDNYDKMYCSIIFKGSEKWMEGKNIIYGGTGYSLNKNLPDYVEKLKPDYSIYPNNNISYNFISRGCIRKCSFCAVVEKEGGIRQVNGIDEIIGHKKIKFLDNNFLALPNHKILLKNLADKKIKCQFVQGLDIRLVDSENSYLLSKLNYFGDYIFAFDDWAYLKIIDEKLNLLNWRRDWQFKFFVYCNPKIDLSNIINRIKYLRRKKCLPYFMRDIQCWDSKHNKFFIDLAAWCNQPKIFKNMSFFEFLNKRHIWKTRNERINLSMFLYGD